MLMTTAKLITLRIFNVTFGRTSFFSKVFKEYMIRKLITSKSTQRYVASSKFYVHEEI